MIAHLLRSWRSLHPAEALAFVVAALLFGVIDLTSLLELDVGDQLPQVLARHMVVPLVSCAVLLLCWLPAARSSPTHPRRRLRLGLATLVGSALTIAIVYPLIALLPWPSTCDLYAAARGKPSCMNWSAPALVGDLLWVFMPALMIVGMLEFRALRRRQHQAVDALLREHGQLRREALASRLAVLQAQVDPTLLFDALVAVEEAYESGDPQASARLERLIRHLRVALPRLRDEGATLGHEAELIASYLDLLRDLQGQAPRFDCELGTRAGTCLPPMLLMPLVQRALRLGRPTRCWLDAGPPLRLGFDAPDLCNDDAELVALRERLAVLGATLDCRSSASSTEFTLALPQQALPPRAQETAC